MFLNIDAIKNALCDNSPEDLAVMIENELEKVAQEELAKKAAEEKEKAKAKEKENEISLLRDMAVEAIAEYFEALGVEITDSHIEGMNNMFKKYEKLIPSYMDEKAMISKILNKNNNWTTFLF